MIHYSACPGWGRRRVGAGRAEMEVRIESGFVAQNGQSAFGAFPHSAGLPRSGEDLGSGLLSFGNSNSNWESWGGLEQNWSCVYPRALANCWGQSEEDLSFTQLPMLWLRGSQEP